MPSLKLKPNQLKRLALFFIFPLFISIVAGDDSTTILLSAELPTGNKVKASGMKLMSQRFGFTRISDDSSSNSKTLVIGVHGRKSEGYEWIYSLTTLSKKYRYTYFYRYEWELCPDSASVELAVELSRLIATTPGVEELIIFGHSYGGIVVTELASKIHLNLPVEIHSIASPLRGYDSLSKRCDLSKQRDGTLLFPIWEDNISHFQWRTEHKLDGVFRKSKIDPQDVNLYKSEVALLPQSINGRRLGHNWSITWVIDEFLRIPHKP